MPLVVEWIGIKWNENEIEIEWNQVKSILIIEYCIDLIFYNVCYHLPIY